MKYTTSLILFFFINFTFAQESLDSVVPIKISFLDSIKKTFENDETAACVDASIINELTNKELFDELIKDIENFDFSETVDYELSTDLLKERLQILDDKSDFDITYNPGLENVIKHYLKNRKKSIERLMGMSEYYFPLYESTLAKHNVPLEIKYLSIVESALNPKAVSRVGATGLWQFMYYTGKEYGLEIDTYIDERSDPIKSSEAACEYMKKMYKIFGDWNLVLASYNAGPGNVSKAIRRSGGKQNYWNIRPFLPRETQGYVPAFLATMYMFEFHKEHGMKPNKPIANLHATDTILIKNKITFKQISDLLEISEEHIKFFNPIYKRDVIPYIKDKPTYLRLPTDKIAVFTSNEDKMYAYANYDFNKKEKYVYKEKEVIANTNSSNNSTDETTKIIEKVKYHKVRRGETLSEIANKYNVSLKDIKKWNGLRKSTAVKGANLKIISQDKITIQPKVTRDTNTSNVDTQVASNDSNNEKKSEPIVNNVVESKTEITQVDNSNSNEVKSVENSDSIIHEVKKGEYLITIANKYKTSIDKIREYNVIDSNGIYEGQKLIIFTNTKLEETINNESDLGTKKYHKVKAKETLYNISKKYNLSINTIKKLNNLDRDYLYEGEKLLISDNKFNEEKKIVVKVEKKSKKETYRVKRGDTLIEISRKLDNVSVKDLQKWNNLKDGDIKVGMVLKIKA